MLLSRMLPTIPDIFCWKFSGKCCHCSFQPHNYSWKMIRRAWFQNSIFGKIHVPTIIQIFRYIWSEYVTLKGKYFQLTVPSSNFFKRFASSISINYYPTNIFKNYMYIYAILKLIIFSFSNSLYVCRSNVNFVFIWTPFWSMESIVGMFLLNSLYNRS